MRGNKKDFHSLSFDLIKLARSGDRIRSLASLSLFIHVYIPWVIWAGWALDLYVHRRSLYPLRAIGERSQKGQLCQTA